MFRNKEYILEVYNQRNFSKAAEKLYISQPSLSAVIKRVENKIAAPIFNRTTPLTLTEVGENYIKTALEIKEKEESFQKYIADRSQLLKGNIKIGGSSLFSSFLLPKLISDFNRFFPDISFDVYEDNTKNLIEKLFRGELDIIIDNSEIKDVNINSKILIKENLILAVPRDYKINEELKNYRFTVEDIKSNMHCNTKKAINIKSFAKQPFILLNPENDTGKRAEKIFKKSNIIPNVVFTLDQQVTSYNISSLGMGISFVSDTLVRHIDSNSALYYYCLPENDAERNICFFTKSNRYLPLASQKFIELSISR